MRLITTIIIFFFITNVIAQVEIKGTIQTDSADVIPFASIHVLGDTTFGVSDFDGNFNFKTNQNFPISIYAYYPHCYSDTLILKNNTERVLLTIKDDCIRRIKYPVSKILKTIDVNAYYVDVSNLYTDFPIIKGDSIKKIGNYKDIDYLKLTPKRFYQDGKGNIKKGEELIKQKKLYLENWIYTAIYPNKRKSQIPTLKTQKHKSYIHNGDVLMDKVTLKAFISELELKERKKNYIYLVKTTGNASPAWLKKSDIAYLMTLIDSKQDSKCVMSSLAAYAGIGGSTIGDQAIMILEYYRNKADYPGVNLICADYDEKKRKEVKKWWLKVRRTMK